MEHADNGDRAAHDRSNLARTIMRRQARIGLRVATGFLIVLLGLPLLNLYYPAIMATRIGGFSLTWLALGVLLYPVMWVLSFVFVRGSDRIEEEIVREFGETLADRGSRIADQPDAARLDDPRSSDPPSAIKKKLFVEEDAE